MDEAPPAKRARPAAVDTMAQRERLLPGRPLPAAAYQVPLHHSCQGPRIAGRCNINVLQGPSCISGACLGLLFCAGGRAADAVLTRGGNVSHLRSCNAP